MAIEDSDYDSDLTSSFFGFVPADRDGEDKVYVYCKTFGDYLISRDRDGYMKVTCGACGESMEDPESPDGFDPTELHHHPDCPWVDRLKQLDSKK